MKRNKQGISLITLVITIIIMIILAGVVMISLTNSGIFNKANEATGKYNLQQVQAIADLAWADAYKGPETTVAELQEAVNEALKDNKLNDKYEAIVDEKGVSIKEKYTGSTLGSLITSAEMYGTKVNYEANGVTDWKVFYKQTVNEEEYVYLIASEKLAYDKVPSILAEKPEEGGAGATVTSATVKLGANVTRTVGQISWSSVPTGIDISDAAKDKWLAKWSDYKSGINSKCVSYFLDEGIWKDFANTKDYVDATGEPYVVGAIGTPTAEMFVASWNEKRLAETNTSKIELKLTPNGTAGYYINGTNHLSLSTNDLLYIWSNKEYSPVWLASPAGDYMYYILNVNNDGLMNYDIYYYPNYGVRPVICLKASIPASLIDGNFVIK